MFLGLSPFARPTISSEIGKSGKAIRILSVLVSRIKPDRIFRRYLLELKKHARGGYGEAEKAKRF